jgi:NADPH:quinone reductase-like Zn-dependent oxidoreductase
VAVKWSAVNPADAMVSSGALVGRLLHARVSPLVLGYDLSGVVLGSGADVHELRKGDEVFGHLPFASSTRQGAFAEYVVVARDTVARKPAGLPHDVAAACATPGLTALKALRDVGRLRAGGRALVVGAAGGVGSLAVGIAKRLGARVTAVCSTYAVEFVRALGADEVVDRQKEDPLALRGSFDVLFDAAPAYSYLACRHLLAPGGTYVRTLPDLGVALGKIAALFSSRRCELVAVKPVRKDLELLASWIERGLPIPIEARFPVRDLQRALERLERGQVRGRLAVQVDGGFE